MNRSTQLRFAKRITTAPAPKPTVGDQDVTTWPCCHHCKDLGLMQPCTFIHTTPCELCQGSAA